MRFVIVGWGNNLSRLALLQIEFAKLNGDTAIVIPSGAELVGRDMEILMVDEPKLVLKDLIPLDVKAESYFEKEPRWSRKHYKNRLNFDYQPRRIRHETKSK